MNSREPVLQDWRFDVSCPAIPRAAELCAGPGHPRTLTHGHPAGPRPAPPPVIRREDYRPPDWLVPDVSLDFDLSAAETRVVARLTLTRNGAHDRPIRLDGDGLVLKSVALDGAALGGGDFSRDGEALLIPAPGDRHVVETEVTIAPEKNTQLMGLYASGGLLCTQCEPEGFRRITFFPDRPDVLSAFDVMMRADKAALSGAARQWRPGANPAISTVVAIGRAGSIPSPSQAISSRWLPAILPAMRTASRR